MGIFGLPTTASKNAYGVTPHERPLMPELNRQRQTLQGQLDSLKLRIGNQLPTKTWRDLQRNQHDRAFVVAGAMKADLLNDLANAVNDAMSKGLGLDYFQKEFDRIVAKHGWEYNGERRWRAGVIYGTNMRVSYAAGRLAQLRDPELIKLKPFWMYRHSGAENPRLQHKAWDKLVLRHDDPFWNTHYPPNGWGCGCGVTAVSARDIARMGGRIEKPPEGTDGIDEGWDYMPGRDFANDQGEFLASKIAALAPPLAARLSADAANVFMVRKAINDVRAAARNVGKNVEFAALVIGGKKLWQKQGRVNAVQFANEELAQLPGGTLVHNHPSSTSLNRADLAFSRNHDVRVIAVGNDLHVFDGNATTNFSAQAYDDVVNAVAQWTNNNAPSDAEADQWLYHLVNKVAARKGLIEYRAELDVVEPSWIEEGVEDVLANRY
jgi:hypothetical protein